MPFFKFQKDDVLTNTLKIHPEHHLWFHDGEVYLDKETPETGQFHSASTNLKHLEPGEVSLYEYNVDRDDTFDANMVRPYVVKNGDYQYFGGTTWDSYNYGDTIYGSYPVKAKVESYVWVDSGDGQYLLPSPATANAALYSYGQYRPKMWALKNTINYHRTMSTTFDYGTLATDYVRMLSIPSILFGSGIKKGTVELNFYVDGDLIGTLTDSRENGELIQSNGSVSANDGEVAGFVLYGEGIVILTAAWSLEAVHTEAYERQVGKGVVADSPRWVHFGCQEDPDVAGTGSAPYSSFEMKFQGTQKIQNKTMFMKIPKGLLNYSNNPTFIEGSRSYTVGEEGYTEQGNDLQIKNTVKSSFSGDEADFQAQVWVTKVGIYDKNRRLIAIVKLAKPLKCSSDRSYTIKAGIDI
jgi:hypothetical protein